MLASTMQFSNNQHSRKHTHHSLRTQQRARPDHIRFTFHAEAVLVNPSDRAE